jgi:PAS domain S-box-containing protein
MSRGAGDRGLGGGSSALAEEAFRLLVDSVEDYAIFLLDPRGRVASWNAGAARIKGYRAEEIIGEHLSRFYAAEDVARGKPDIGLERARADGRFEDTGWRVRKDGSLFWAHVVLTAVHEAGGKLIGFAKVTRDLTEQRLADEALRLSEARLAATLTSIGDGVISTDAEGRVVWMNPVAERLTGWITAEAIGRPIAEVFRIIHEETRAPVESPVSRVLRDGVVVGLANHTALIARDGTERAVADSGAPIRIDGGPVQGVVLVFRDVTEERLADEALRQSEERLRLLIASVDDYAIFMLDPTGRVITWNPGAQRIKGYQAEEIVGQSFSRFYPEEDVAVGRPKQVLAAAAEHGRTEEEAWRVRKDGTRFWAHVVVNAVHDARGQLRGFAKVTRDLTQRRQAEENERALIREQAARAAAEGAERRLRESEERYRESSEQLSIILQNVDEGIVVHGKDGRLVYANDAAARTWGFSTGPDLVTARREDIRPRFEITDEDGTPVPPEEMPPRAVLRGETPGPRLLRIRNRTTGGQWWALVAASGVRTVDGEPYLAVSIWHDLTNQRQAEERARYLAEATAVVTSSLDYETTLRRIADLAVPELADWCGVDLMQPDGTLAQLAVAHVDPAKVELARELNRRYPPDPASPTGAPNVVRTGKPEIYADIPEELLVAGARDDEHLRFIRVLGLRSAMCVPLVAGGKPVGAISFVSAESQRRYGASDLELAVEIGRRAGLAIDNARLYRDAQQAIRARDEFISIASHELRTPCTTIQLRLQSLQRSLERQPQQAVASGRVAHDVKVALDQMARFTRLIDQLLDVSSLAADRFKLEPAANDLGAIVSEVAARYAPAMTEAGCELSYQAPLRPVTGNWDRLRLEQVVTNLISNAIKYGPRKPIELRIEQSDGTARLTVRDQGIGISEHDQARVFEPFERAVSVRHYGGFGLGLWITRKIVEAHGGAIRVQSRPGEGSTFVVELPSDRDEEHAA